MWFKVDDGFHSSRKLLSIPKRHRLAAAGLWVIAGSWCGQQLTNGRVPDYMLKEWGATPATVQALLDSGLWEVESDANVFYKWHEYQPSKRDVDAERAASRERMRDLRAKRKGVKPQESGAKGDMFARTSPNGSESVRNPDPTRPDPVSKDTESVSAKPKTRQGNDTPEHRATDAAYEATGKAFNFIAVRAITKWMIHERGLNEQQATQAITDTYQAGKPITKQVLGQLIDGYNQNTSGSQRRLQQGADLVQRIAARGQGAFDYDPFEGKAIER